MVEEVKVVKEVKILEKPWVEKYRPERLDDIVGQDHIVKRLKHYVKTGSMPHLLFAGPPGVGKCLTGDVKVIANGRLCELGELVEKVSNGRFGPTPVKGLKVLGIDEDGKLREFEVQYVYKDRAERLIRIRTRLGRELKVTPYHPLLVNRKNGEIKWVKAEELKPGDKLAVPRFLPAIAEEDPLAEWLGYFIGDGHADSRSNVITFTNADPSLRRRFMELTERLFPDAKIKERIHKNRAPDVYVNSRKAWELVSALGFAGRKADKVYIPEKGWEGIRSFLRAYFDCDAGVDKNAIVLATASREMAEQVTYGLAGFGIISKIREKKVRGKLYYHVTISGSENVERFLSEIGFSHREKLEKAKKLVKKFNPNLDSLKVNYELISYVRDRLKLNFSDDKRSWSHRKAREISWELMKEIYYRLDELERLKESLSRSILIDWNEVAERRKEIAEKTGIRVDRLLEYIKGKRKPSLRNYLKIAKALGIDLEPTIDAMRVFARKYSSYAEIGRKLGTWNSSVRIILESNTEKIEKLEEIRKIELELIGEILSDEKLKEGVAYLIFLSQNELYWDEITEVKELKGDFVIYDLHVPGYHNFIAGNMPTVVHNTTAALALARELFGEGWRHNFLELNASVSKDTPILVRLNGKVMRTTFAELDKIYFDENDGEVAYKDAMNLEVLTVDENYKVRWARVSKIIRHRVPVILKIHLEGGGTLELTGNHSVMVLTENGLESVKASELKEGSYLLSFVSSVPGFLDVLNMEDYTVKPSARVRTFGEIPLNDELAYMMGLYAAEGAVSFKGVTSGQVIYTLGSHEGELIERVREFAEGLGVSVYENYTTSGFDRSRRSAYQIRLLSTQLARFFEDNFYDGHGRRSENKRVPGFIFEASLEERIAFLKGLADVDGSGEWESVVRVSSVSKDMLIDTVWLARISGIEASLFEREARLIWKGGMKWAKAELLPAEPIIKMLLRIEDAVEGNWRYNFRHQLYEGKKRVGKGILRDVLDMVNVEKLDDEGREIYETLRKLAYTDLHALAIRKIELIEYNDFVYDVSVPGNETFFAGEIPVLLHNSDERGINVIREKVKEFARTKPIGGASFKIIFLDEADALTQDAQQALRRTMEMFSSNVRFILSCVTGDTRIYTPDEREVKIKDFLKFYERGLVREVSNRNGRDTVIAAVAFNSKIIGHPVFRLTLESGRVIEATGDHMFLTPAGWVQTYDLKEGSEVLVKPTLEGTPYEVNPEPIVDLRDFYEFANKLELERGRKPLGEARNFRELTTKDKEKILARALELKAEMEKGLTEREAEILQEISTEWTSREEIQKKVGLSRARLNQLLKNLEEKGYVERRMEGKRQFVRKLRDGVPLRNTADVKRILEKELGIKISYTAVKRLLAGELDGPAYNLLRELKKRWLVRYDDERAGILARVLGFLLGDGHLAKGGTRVWFNSSREELEALAEDLRRLGLKPSEIIERESSSEIGGRKVKGKIHMLYVDNRALHALMRFWGVEAGNKTKKGYRVPEWIRKGNLFVKREFLRGLFAADGTKPYSEKYNFNGIKLEMRTSSESLEETTEFFNDLAELLREFEVDSKVIVSPIGDGFIVRLVVTPNESNYLKFLTRVGYAYVKDKYARLVGEYLRMKLTYKEIILPQIAEKAVELAAKTNPTQAAKLLGVKRDFVVNRLNGVPIGLTRDFMTFEDFRRERVTGDYVVEKVIKKEELGYLDVYDVTCASDHSFISNGLVSHNCNYSSKIIEPIQSRCAIFRFRPLKDEDIAKRLKYIAENEGLELTEEGLQAILYVAEGDLRRAINVLQAAAALDVKITDENVFLVASRARPEDVREMMLLALEGNFLKARDKLREILLKQGLSGEDVLIQMHKEVFNLPISEPKKVALADKIGEYNFRLVEGANEMIQLEALLAQFTLLGKD